MSILKEAGDLIVIIIKVLVRALLMAVLLSLINTHVEFWILCIVALMTL